MKRVLLLIAIALTFCIFLTYSQTRKERVRITKAQINTLLASYADGPYKASGVIDVDSSIGVRKVADGKITNPYGTLNRCYLFMARTQGGEGKHIIGVYRDNQIVWMSEQLPGSENYGYLDEEFIATKDLNRMGMVDIVAYFSDGTNPPSGYYLWIFSWDGSQGVCINKQESNGETSITSTGAFEIFDVDADGLDEIISFGSDYKSNSAYSWNGSLYGNWPNSPDLQGRSYTISNNLAAIVKSLVQRVGEGSRYSYEVTNNNNSKQKIESFYIKASIDTVDSVKVPIGWQGGQWAGYPLINCFTENENLQIDTGQTLRPFSFDCLYLPTITTFYIHGPTHALDYSTSNADTLMAVAYNNVLTNSFIGATIGPTNSPVPFIPLNFLDTIAGYTTQSRSLGWIKDSLTAVKYLGYFSTAKTELQQNDTATAKSTLRQVLSDVDVDSTNYLTSEVYALLRFNTEYLIPRIVPLDTLRVPSQYATIQSAINIADSGRVILVSAGTYNEQDSINIKKSLKLIALDTLVPLGNVTVRGVTISNSTSITVKGFKINASGTSQDGVQLTGTQNKNITIEANDVQYSSRNGITIGQNNDTVNIVNNVIANNALDGISFATGATGTQYIVNNTIVKNGKCGIEAVGPQKLLIVNNIIIYDTLAGRSGERLVSGAGITYIMQKNNLVFRRQDGVIQNNYRLVPGSIAIDKGTTNFAPLPTKDKDGNPRVSGPKIDVGAYESQQ